MATPSNRIDADSNEIEKVFKSFFAVPDFQREYIWKQRHVNKLLNDLYTAFASREADSYFLGSIVFYDHEDVNNLVDGQQRMTTLFVLISAIRDRLAELDEDAELAVYEGAIKDSYKSRKGGTEYRYRVVLQYPEIHQVLQLIGDGKRKSIILPKGESPRRNLTTAYDLCQTFLVEQFGSNVNRLDDFFTFVWKDVELITIETDDMRTAFTIFETINERGVGLDAMDLLKNLLFRNTPDETSRKQLGAKWKELLKNLRDAGESKPIRFLRYFLIAEYDFERVPTAKSVFDWITTEENQKLLGYGKKPMEFAESLLSASEAYGRFLQGLDAEGNENSYLEAINFQRTGVRQHLCILMAARKRLSATAFDTLASALETLIFVLASSGVQWNEIEKALPEWCKDLRAASSVADVEAFIEKSLSPMITGRLDRFAERLADTSKMPNRLVRYLLASLTQFLEEQTGKGGGFERYFKEKLSIEHIFPQSTTDEPLGKVAKEWIDAFKPTEEAAYYVYRLGNLTLLHQTPNYSAGNHPYHPRKFDWYTRCTYDLTRAIAEPLESGKNNKITKTVNKYGLHPFPEWTPHALEERHTMMLRMVEEYWGIELPATPRT